MKDLYDKTIDDDGLFEGVYDHMPNYGEDATEEQLARYMPFISRWDLAQARPEIFGFDEAIDRHIPELSPPYRQTNTLVQVGLQYWNEHEDRAPVPDGYKVRYSRSGRGRISGTDQTKSLTLDILRATVAEQIAGEEDEGTHPKIDWQRVARVGQPFGNAILAYSLDTHSYNSFTSRQTTGKQGKLLPVTDRRLAEAVFKDILYWQE